MTKKRTTTVALYVPGLGDKKRLLLWVQKIALSSWRVYGLRFEMIPMLWTDPVPLEPRFEALLKRIDELHAAGHKVALIGTSAGASAVVAALSERKQRVTGVVTICGKLKGTIPEAVKEVNPSFAASLQLLERALGRLDNAARKKILNLRAVRDAIVPPEEAVVDGGVIRDVKVFGHNTACLYILFFRGRSIAHFLRHKR